MILSVMERFNVPAEYVLYLTLLLFRVWLFSIQYRLTFFRKGTPLKKQEYTCYNTQQSYNYGATCVHCIFIHYQIGYSLYMHCFVCYVFPGKALYRDTLIHTTYSFCYTGLRTDTPRGLIYAHYYLQSVCNLCACSNITFCFCVYYAYMRLPERYVTITYNRFQCVYL